MGATRGLQEAITHDHIAGVKERLLDVKAIMSQIAECLQHMHTNKAIHGDLKPLNVMYETMDQRWKLIDLDAAAKIGDKSGLKSSAGYAPPELFIERANGKIEVRNPVDTAEACEAQISFDM